MPLDNQHDFHLLGRVACFLLAVHVAVAVHILIRLNLVFLARRYLASDCAAPLEILLEHYDREATAFAAGLDHVVPKPPTAPPTGASSAGPSFVLPTGSFGQVPTAAPKKKKQDERERLGVCYFLSDTFHDLQALRDAFGTTNTYSAFFVKAVANSTLIYDPDDYQAGLDYLMSRNNWSMREAKININRFIKNHPEHFRKTYPDPVTLYTSMKLIENIFKDCVCTKGKKPAKLFNEKRWEKWNAHLQRILAGHVAEAPGARYTYVCQRNGLPVYKVRDQTSAEEAFHRFQKDIAAAGSSVIWIHCVMFPFILRWNIGADCRLGRPHFGHKHVSGDTARDVPVYCTKAIERQAIAARASPMHDASPYTHVRLANPDFKTSEKMCASREMKPAYAGILKAVNDGRDVDDAAAALLLDLQVDHLRKPVEVLCAADMRSVLHISGYPNLTDGQTLAVSKVNFAVLPRDVAVANLAAVAVDCMCLKPGEQHSNRNVSIQDCQNALANVVFGRNHETGDKLSPADMDVLHGAHFKALAGQGHLSFDYKAGQTDFYQLQRLQGISPEVAQYIQPCIGTRAGYELYANIISDLKAKSKKSANKKLSNQDVSVEWNKRVFAKLQAAKTPQEKDLIGRELGFQLDRAIERLANQVSKKVVSAVVHGDITTALHDLAKRNLALRKTVSVASAPLPPPAQDSSSAPAIAPAIAPSAAAAKVGVPVNRQPTDVSNILNLPWIERASMCLKCYMGGATLSKCRQWSPKKTSGDKDEKATLSRSLEAIKAGGKRMADNVAFRNGHKREPGNGARISCTTHPNNPTAKTELAKAIASLRRKVQRHVQGR